MLSLVRFTLYSFCNDAYTANAGRSRPDPSRDSDTGGGGFRYPLSPHTELVGFDGHYCRFRMEPLFLRLVRARSRSGGVRAGLRALLPPLSAAGAWSGRCETAGGGGCHHWAHELLLGMFADRNTGRRDCNGDAD